MVVAVVVAVVVVVEAAVAEVILRYHQLLGVEYKGPGLTAQA